MKRAYNITIFLTLIFLTTINQWVNAQGLSPADQQKAEQYEKKISSHRSSNNLQKELDYCNKIAFIYWQNNLNEKALKYFERCLEINEKLGNKNGIKLTSYYVGMIYSDKEQYKKALEYFEKGLSISRELNLNNSILSGLINLAQTHQIMGNYKKSNEYSLEALDLAKEEDNLKSVRTCYGMLSDNYKSLGNSKKSIKYFDLFSSIDQHLKDKKISEIKKETEDEVTKARKEKQKTEKELAEEISRRKTTEDSLQKVERISRERQMQLEMKELEIKRKQAKLKLERTIRNSLIIGFLLIGVFSVLLFYFYRQKKKANKKLEIQNKKIYEQNQQIQQQKNILEIQNTKLNDSLSYAVNIQEAILPLQSQIKEELDVFVLHRPKDIVSGDFYWFTKIYNAQTAKPITYLAVVDCTGHGVPGAFMSLIGNRILNEIISEKNVLEPSRILYLLNQHIVDALKQETTDNTDGMDVCLISIENKVSEKNGKKITFAGAKRPLYFWRKNNGTIEKLEGNRYSIGGINKNKKEKEFSSTQIELEKGDILYLTTDGLFDQVNSSRKRFTSKRFLDILNQNIKEPLDNQRSSIEYAFDEFKNDSEQRDDITVIGAKIK